MSSSDYESDTPVAVPLKAARNEILNDAKDKERSISLEKKRKKNSIKEIRARRHERNIQQKKVKTTQDNKMKAMLLDTNLLQSAKALKTKIDEEEIDEDKEMDTEFNTTAEEHRSNQDLSSGASDNESDSEPVDYFHKDPGVHVVSATESTDYFLKKALQWKQEMLYGPSINRMTYAEYKSMKEKKEAENTRPKLEKRTRLR
ncbi:uncharacterized protein LOC108681106 [Hyalella azteca]|uniref:Uncharacterized protein LOC108681106 n=1 Tax=Hyalella azteca TaxID=294128 RepID=A0A8B7PJP3_HYAAZ|nr:uncharacterized protein LOC108681106 [Hyalella azteca]